MRTYRRSLGKESNVTAPGALKKFNKVDPLQFRDVLGHYPTGVVLVTGIADDGLPVGMIVGSFTSVSLEPPLIAFLPSRSSRTFDRLRTADSFCVNVLAADQEVLCRTFAGGGNDKFANVGWESSPSGAPILDGTVAWIDCTFHSINDGGDHYIALGSVIELAVRKPAAPLLFFQGGYGRFAPLSLMARPDADFIAGVQFAELARTDMEELAALLNVECAAMSTVGSDVVVVASAAGPGATPASRLGARTPLMPPLGEAFVASERTEVIDSWLSRAASVDDYTSSQYQERLEVTRRRGWSMALVGEYKDRELFEALREYSAGDLTPARERHIKAVVAHVSSNYEPVDLVPEEQYSVAGIVVPVFDEVGHVKLVLRISQLPGQASAADVTHWVNEILSASAKITARIICRNKGTVASVPEEPTSV